MKFNKKTVLAVLAAISTIVAIITQVVTDLPEEIDMPHEPNPPVVVTDAGTDL